MPLEPSSTDKAVQTAAGYKGGVAACAGTGVNAVGAFAFTNERKFEGSATWFGLWASTPAISNNALQPLADRWSTLSSIWSGAAPEPGTVRDKLKGHKLPVIAAIAADKEGRLAPGASFSASATLSDPSLSSSYTGQWEIRADITPGAGASGATGTANAPEPRMYGTGKSADGGLRGGALTVQMQAPSNPGAYRLTLILAPTNGQRGVVTASVPLLIK